MINLSKPIIEENEINAVVSVLKSGMLAQGEVTKKFEEDFAKKTNKKYAIAVSNGTAGLHTALHAIGIKEGDEVITTPFTFVATANAILMVGAKPVFVDINEDDFCIDPKKIEEKITKNTKAILGVNLYGQIYNYEKINNICKKYNLKLVEDACQSIGAERNGVVSGNFGDIAVFSLYATKNIVTGEGGMIVTDNEEVNEKCRRFRHHGQDEKIRYNYIDLGYNYRITDIASAIGVEQIKRLEDISKKRNDSADTYNELLKNIDGLILPKVSEGNKHVYHQYTIKIIDDGKNKRERLIDYLKDNNISSGIYYPKSLHLFEHFKKFGYSEGDFPISEKMSKEVLSLPIHPSLTKDEIIYICENVINFMKNN